MQQAVQEMEATDGRRVRGDESRRAILARAVDIASVDGLDGLTIGRLASEVPTSKSGIATLFGSKESLQLAVIDAADAIFTDAVVARGRAEPRGLSRVCALIDAWIDYSENRVFAGGCFFAAVAADFDAKPGAVRDRIVSSFDEWEGYLALQVRFAAERGGLAGTTDALQLTFEIVALLRQADASSMLRASTEPYSRARSAIGTRLVASGADPAVLADFGLA